MAESANGQGVIGYDNKAGISVLCVDLLRDNSHACPLRVTHFSPKEALLRYIMDLSKALAYVATNYHRQLQYALLAFYLVLPRSSTVYV